MRAVPKEGECVMSDLEKAARMVVGAWLDPHGMPELCKAMESLSRALEQTALCKYGNEPTSCTSSPMDCQCALDAVFEQPAQQQEQAMLDALVGGTGIMKNGKRIDPESVRQEPAPVAHLLLKNGKKSSFWFDKGDAYDLDLSEGYEWVDLYTRPQAQQEPVAWRYKKEGGGWFVSDNDPQYVEQWNDIAEIQPLYTAPQPAQQPLTDEQINDHRLALGYDFEDLPDPWDFKQGVRAAERAHRIGEK